jgi:hypothetical protein
LIEHLFWECLKVKIIWLQLEEFLHDKQINYKFTSLNVLLGDNNGSMLIEHIQLITKESQYNFRLKQEEPTFKKIIYIIKYKAKIEKHYTQDLDTHEEKWGNILN